MAGIIGENLDPRFMTLWCDTVHFFFFRLETIKCWHSLWHTQCTPVKHAKTGGTKHGKCGPPIHVDGGGTFRGPDRALWGKSGTAGTAGFAWKTKFIALICFWSTRNHVLKHDFWKETSIFWLLEWGVEPHCYRIQRIWRSLYTEWWLGLEMIRCCGP